MYIYLHIDVAFVLFAIVEILKVTLIIIEKCSINLYEDRLRDYTYIPKKNL